MFKVFGWVATAVTAAFVWSAPAQAIEILDVQSIQLATMMEAQATTGLNWKVGDKTSHKISGGIMNGKSDAFVREDTGSSFWLENNLDLGFMGKQKMEILLNKNTGAIEKLLVNGKEQQVPEADIEVVEMKEAKIRVPAGEFDCIYVKVNDKKSSQMQEAWVNPQAVPMSGTLKSMSDSQFGKIVQELTSFQFATR